MAKKICIIGTHGAGKTTLSYILAAHYKKLGKSVKIVQEVARSCPYPLNDGMTRESCLWIYHEQIKKELEALRTFDTVICDRSAIDSFIYAKAQKCFNYEDSFMALSYQAAHTWMYTYEKVIFVNPGNIEPVDDGVRSTDKMFQTRVHDYFLKWAHSYEKELPMVYLSGDIVFSNPDLSVFD